VFASACYTVQGFPFANFSPAWITPAGLTADPSETLVFDVNNQINASIQITIEEMRLVL